MKTTVTVDEVVELLNALIGLSPQVMHAIMEHQVQGVPPAMSDRPNFQLEDGGSASAFSLLNGLFGLNAEGKGPFERHYDEATILSRVEKRGDWEG